MLRSGYADSCGVAVIASLRLSRRRAAQAWPELLVFMRQERVSLSRIAPGQHCYGHEVSA
jgi:hypothetical protein